MQRLPDDDPTDNKIQFMQKFYSSSFDSDGFSGRSRFMLKKLVHNFKWEEQEDLRPPSPAGTPPPLRRRSDPPPAAGGGS